MKKNFLTFLIGLILIGFSISGQFASADLEKLLNSEHRPSIADIKQEATAQDLTSVQSEFAVNHFGSYIGTLIAELEWAYPGAIYMPLGRDAVYMGDFIDAFYHSQGQPNRVLRLNASGQSLKVSEDIIARFVQSSGVDIKNLAKGPDYVFFDSSTYVNDHGQMSQSVKILSAVYNEYRRQGGHAKDILTKFAFFNLYSGTISAVVVDPKLDRNEFLREQYLHLEKNPSAIPNRIFAASRQFFYIDEWHGPFKLLQEMPDGSVLAQPDLKPYPIQAKKQVLQNLLAMMNEVTKPEFLGRIQSRARQLGYEFKFKQNCDQELAH